MKDLKLNFLEDGVELDLNSSVSGLAASSQVVATSLATSTGSDLFFPERGNDLFVTFARNGLVSKQTAQHEANFAAVGSKVFYNNVSSGEELSRVLLSVSVATPSRLRISASLVFSTTAAVNLNLVV
jgi:hypothetical protein